MDKIKLTFPDGNVKEFDAGITIADVADSISKSLKKAALAGKLDGEIIDYHTPITKDGAIEVLQCQAPSGKMISGRDFINGHNNILGKSVSN